MSSRALHVRAVAAPGERRDVGRLVDVAVTLGVLGVAVFLVVRFFVHAGPLWRDEIETINLAKYPAAVLWAWLDRIPVPPPYPLLLRGLPLSAFGDEDAGIRVLGLVLAIATFAVIWRVGQQMTGRPPALALALWGTNAIALHTSATLTVYAPGTLAVVATFGAVWALATAPGVMTALVAAIAATVAVQLQYQNLLHVAAIALAGTAISAGRRRFRVAAMCAGVLVVAGASLLPYRAALERSMAWRLLTRNPLDASSPFARLAEVLSADSLPLLVVWLAIGGLVIWGCARMMTLAADETSHRQPVAYAMVAAGIAVALVLGVFGVAGPVAMARHLVALLAVLALAVNVVVMRLVPRWARVAAVVAVVAVASPVAMERLAWRQTSVDLVARYLAQTARPGDLIVVNPWFVGLTFGRYYDGTARWTTIPPVGHPRHHFYDLVRERMSSAEPLAPLFADIAGSLEHGGRVWFVGAPAFLPAGRTAPTLPAAPATPTGWFDVPYLVVWSMQTGDFVKRHAVRWELVQVPSAQTVSPLERPSVVMVEGWAGGRP